MNPIKLIKNTIKYWYLILLAGIILILVGLWAIIFSQQSIVLIAIVFSLTFLFTGFFEAVFAILNRGAMNNWGWGLVLGIIKLVFGGLLIANPNISVLTLALFVGFMVLFLSLAAIVVAFDLKRYFVLDWGNLLALGIVGLIFSCLLLINLHFTTAAIVVCLSFSLIINGVISIYSSLKLKNIKSFAQKISSDLISRYEEIEKEVEDVFRES